MEEHGCALEAEEVKTHDHRQTDAQKRRARERACEWCRGVSSLCTLCVNTLPLASSWHALTLIPMLHSSQLISPSLTSSHLKLWVKYLTSSNLFSSYFSSYVMHLAETLGDAPAASESYSESWCFYQSHCPKPHGNPFRCSKKNTFLPKPSTLLLWDCFASQKIGQKLKALLSVHDLSSQRRSSPAKRTFVVWTRPRPKVKKCPEKSENKSSAINM